MAIPPHSANRRRIGIRSYRILPDMGTCPTGFAPPDGGSRLTFPHASSSSPSRRVYRWDNDWAIETAMAHKDQWLYAIDFSGN